MERSAALFRAWQAKLAGPALPFLGENGAAGSGDAAAGKQYRREQVSEESVSLRSRTQDPGFALMDRIVPEAERMRQRMHSVPAGGPMGDGLPAADGAQGVAGIYAGRPALAGGMAQVLVSGWQQDDAANGPAALARQVQGAQERQSLLAMSERFERDARRYDGGFLLY